MVSFLIFRLEERGHQTLFYLGFIHNYKPSLLLQILFMIIIYYYLVMHFICIIVLHLPIS